MESPRPEPIYLESDDPRIVRAADEGNRKQRRIAASKARRASRSTSLRAAIPRFVK